MAKYPKRQKVKRYRRSFYSREMRVKKGIGIAVLVLVVLAAAWVAAPHVLDWATHTWRAQPGSFCRLHGGRERFVRSREHGVVRGRGTGSFFGGPAGGGDARCGRNRHRGGRLGRGRPHDPDR